MPRVVHGAIILTITLALVGVVSTSTDWSDSEDETELAASTEVIEPEPFVAAAPRFDVPIRSGRLSDNEVADVPHPVAVTVPGIGLLASVIPVGVDANNQLDVPSAELVGWYQYGPHPGSAGSTVLAAHVDYGGVPGAFFDLSNVLPGQLLNVELADGSVMSYEVTGNNVYDKTELPAEELFRKDGDPTLYLITCGGTFDPSARSYQANVVVSAVPVSV